MAEISKTSASSSSQSATSQLVQGVAWNYAAFLAAKGLLFVATLILARLLTPSQFGLVGMALLVITGLDILRDFGIGTALIYYQKEGKAVADAAFLVSTSIGALLCAANWVLAPIAVHFFRTQGPEQAALAVALLRVLGFSLLLSGIGSTPDALLRKELDFRRRMVPEVSRALLKGVAQVGLALLGFGAWSLVVGQVAGEAGATALLWRSVRWRPSWTIDRTLIRGMLGYGGQILVVALLGWLIADLDYLIIGATLGEAALGLYTLAFRVPELAIRNLSEAVAGVAFPALARLQDDREGLRVAYLRLQRTVFLVLAPIACGLAAIAPLLVHVLFPERWAPAVVPLQILSVYMLLGGLGHLPGVIYKAIGRPDILSRWNIAKVVILAPVLYWCATRYGVVGVAWGQLVVRVVTLLLDLVIVRRFTAIGVAASLWALRRTMLACGLMILAVRSVVLLDSAERHLSTLAAAVIVGVVVYGAAAWVLERPLAAVLLEQGRGIVRRPAAAARSGPAGVP
jgi:PST family polysaccharide transporter